jgi:tRNA A-37 threonylcarbamoyl transferase component Bud32
VKLLDAACQRHSLAVEPGSFLGYGAHGRVFKVSNSSEEQYAVKLVLKENDDLQRESEALQAAYKVCPKHVIRVVHPPEVVHDVGELMGTEVGGFMVTELGTMVEKDDYKRIIEAMVTLHRSNFTHGDARVYNVVEVEKSIKWIDFREAEKIPTDDSNIQQRLDQRLDMITLMKSLLQISQDGDLPDDVRKLVQNYNGNVTDDQIQTIVDEFGTFYASKKIKEMPVLK